MPKWMDDCVMAYKKKGLSMDEAWKRCKGAEKNRKEGGKSDKKKGK